jgi:hypothetical protein
MVPITNITFERLITTGSPSTLAVDYVDKQGFFFRAAGAGNIKYDPVGNDDGASITKTVTASATFNDPVIAKKIYAVGTTATLIYIGKGI